MFMPLADIEDGFIQLLLDLGFPGHEIAIALWWLLFAVAWGVVIACIVWLYLRAGRRRKIQRG